MIRTITTLLTALSPPLLTSLVQRTVAMVGIAVARRRIGSLTKLHLACGDHLLPGWANIDLEGPSGVIKLDLTRPLPIKADSIEAIYCEHFIEHIDRTQARRLLSECHRVLKPGGVLRLSTPDLRKLVDEYVAGRTDEWHDMHWHPDTPACLLNEGMRLWGHQYLYDATEMTAAVRASGFTHLERVGWRQSSHASLKGLECRPFHDEIILEGTK